VAGFLEVGLAFTKKSLILAVHVNFKENAAE